MLTADSTSLASAKMEGVAENFVSHAFLQGGQWGGGVCVCVCVEKGLQRADFLVIKSRSCLVNLGPRALRVQAWAVTRWV